MIRVASGSASLGKLEAALAGAEGLTTDVFGVGDIDSGVPNQPIGAQIIAGAFNRAYGARLRCPGAYALGIENGIDTAMEADYAIALVITPSGICIFLRSEAVTVPKEIIKRVLLEGQRITGGQIQAELTGSYPYDPQFVWSGGRTNRKTILTPTIAEVLKYAIRVEGETA
jgi:non-canonical (house-cleaning) NTP pyrophosphatase